MTTPTPAPADTRVTRRVRRRVWRLRLLALSLSSLMALGLCELALFLCVDDSLIGRFTPYYQEFDPNWNTADPELIFVRKPFIDWSGLASRDSSAHWVQFRTDENGFRNPPGLREAEIVFIGDSFTEAGNVPEADTFVQQAGQQLGVKVANLGRGWYGPQQELIVLKRWGLPYQPKVVVWVFFEGNDVQDAEKYAIRMDRSSNWLTGGERWRRPAWGWVKRVRTFRLLFGLYEQVAKRPLEGKLQGSDGRQEIIEFHYRHDPRVLETHRRGWRETQASLREARDLCGAAGIRLVVMAIPFKLRVVGPLCQFDSPRKLQEYLPDGDWLGSPAVRGPLADFCAEIQLEFIDTTAQLAVEAASGQQVFMPRKDTHLDVAGHAVVARLLSKHLRSEIYATPE